MAYLAVEVPLDGLVTAIAEEASIIDRDLDSIEKRLFRAEPGETAALALTLGRCARPSARRALLSARDRLAGSLEAKAIGVAIDLLALEPPSHLARGERGYRRVDPATQEELFIEDPLAAHWHHANRWGPPLRPDPTSVHVDAAEPAEVSELVARVKEGAIVIVTFEATGLFAKPSPPLFLLAAGLTRDRQLNTIARWSSIRSVGIVERRGSKRAAYEVIGQPLSLLDDGASLHVPKLVDLLGKLLRAGRGD